MDKELFVKSATDGIDVDIPENMQPDFMQSLCGFLKIMSLEATIKDTDFLYHSDEQIYIMERTIYLEHDFEEYAKLFFENDKIKFLYTTDKEFCTSEQNKLFARFIMYTIEFAKEYNEKIKELKQLQLKGYDESIIDKIKELKANNTEKVNNDNNNDDDSDDDDDSEWWL